MPTLALCVITGPGDASDLARLMESVKGVFDEIVITVTTPEPEVNEVARRYATNLCHFKWCDDFSMARNFCFAQAKSSFIAWLDSDDFLKPEDRAKLIEYKNGDMAKFDVVMMPYIYSSNPDGTPAMVLPRERIVINDNTHRWHEPIHEYLSLDCPDGKMTLVDIMVTHGRNKPFDPARNLMLLEKEYRRPGHSLRCEFYYGKELFDSGRVLEALPVLTKYIDAGPEFNDNKASACIRVAKYWLDAGKYELVDVWQTRASSFHRRTQNSMC